VADDDLQPGDHVTWESHGSTAEGTVEREITSDTEASGRTVRAGGEDPQYEVRSVTSGRTPCTGRPRSPRTDPAYGRYDHDQRRPE
jgi:hypothetical protein